LNYWVVTDYSLLGYLVLSLGFKRKCTQQTKCGSCIDLYGIV